MRGLEALLEGAYRIDSMPSAGAAALLASQAGIPHLTAGIVQRWFDARRAGATSSQATAAILVILDQDLLSHVEPVGPIAVPGKVSESPQIEYTDEDEDSDRGLDSEEVVNEVIFDHQRNAAIVHRPPIGMGSTHVMAYQLCPAQQLRIGNQEITQTQIMHDLSIGFQFPATTGNPSSSCTKGETHRIEFFFSYRSTCS